MNSAAPYDLAPIGTIMLVGLLLALVPLAWVWKSERRSAPGARLRALTWAALFLTFDLVLFGAFTRLTDSGLGCPDWPGCYGQSNPAGAGEHIEAAQQATPTGPVTHAKAWIEMIHRYLATAVGALITVLAYLSWRSAGSGDPNASPRWATLALVWVCLQGAFGALTVTMKLYPAVVTLHLLGGIGLLVILAAQTQRSGPRPRVAVSRSLSTLIWIVAALALLQIALGGWVSTNYAVLACRDFPTCQGSWWPPMDFVEGFNVRRGLGRSAGGGYLPFQALTAIHQAHRIGAMVVLGAIALLVWRLRREADANVRRWSLPLGGVVLWQVLTGLSNVVLGWPLAAALAHTGGAAALAVVLTLLLCRLRAARQEGLARRPVTVSAGAHS
ncbi:MAG: COX15/CtaA family protein [Caldimonas sp.]